MHRGKTVHLGALVALILGGLIAASAAALDPKLLFTQYSRSTWSTAEGLPQNTVRAFAQTPDGFLWLGTQAGLVRFDGLHFEVYDRRRVESFDNHHIYALEVDSSGTLWVGTNGGGLLRYLDGTFQPLDTDAIPTGRITALEAAPDGSLWIGTYGDGLLHYDSKRPAGQELTVYGSAEGLAHAVIFDLALDASGGLWIATYGGGAQRLQGGRFQTFDQDGSGLDNGTWAVEPAVDGSIWVGTNRGLYRWHEGIWQHLGRTDGLSHERVIALREDLDGNLWIGTYGGGLCRRRSNGDLECLNDMQGLPGNIVWSLFEDLDGSVWVGFLGTGLLQLRQGAFVTFGMDEGLSSNITSSLYEDRGGSLWIATRGAGVNVLRPGATSFDVLGREQGLASDGVWQLQEDAQGNIWFATNGGGVQRLTTEGHWTRITRKDGLADDVVFVLLVDSRDRVWMGTNGGLSVLQDDKLHTYTVEDGLPSRQIRSLLEDEDGHLWIGTTRGLCRLDTEAEITHQELQCFTRDNGLPGNNVATLYQDTEGVLWLGMAGDGLVRFDHRDGHQFDALTSRDGFPDDEVSVVLEDDLGFFWLATGRGVFRMSRDVLEARFEDPAAELSYTTYGPRDGIDDRAGQATGLKTSDGRIWITHLGGYSVVDPRDLHVAEAPHILLEHVTVAGQPLRDEGPPLSQWSRDFVFRFTAPTLNYAQRMGFRYRLTGFETDWKTAPRREAVYSYLEPGNYTFETMASDSAGQWNGPVTRFSLRIAPPFYRTSSFFLASILVLLVIGYLAHELRIRGLRERERELNLRVDESMARLKILRGLLPVCSNCHKVREKNGAWQPIERFISEHSEASMSHSVCPDCADELYPGIIQHPDA